MATRDLLDQLQRTLGDGYTVERELARGGMSRVYLAKEKSLDREVVVKVLSPDLAADVNFERFSREIRLAGRLQHPHIVPLLSAGDSRGTPFYVMPFVEGESLRQRLQRRGELPIDETIRILRDVATALEYAHRQGIVHRDIKPENILLSGGGGGGNRFRRRESRLCSDIRRRRDWLDYGGDRAGHAGVYGSRAGVGGPIHRPARRHLRVGGPRVRNADGGGAVLRTLDPGHRRRAHGRAGSGNSQGGNSPAVGATGDARAGKAAGGSSPKRAGARPRAGCGDGDRDHSGRGHPGSN